MKPSTFLTVGALLLMAGTAQAQNTQVLCEFLPGQQASGVMQGAEYVPGVDVHGNPVVAADLGTGGNGLIDVIKIPVSKDLAQGLGQDVPEGIELDAALGMIEIHKDGRTTLNGQDITSNAYNLCGKARFDMEAGQDVSPVKPKAAPAVSSGAQPVEPVDEEIIWGEGY